MLFVVFSSGCVHTVKDMTRESIPKYASVAGKTYVVSKALFLLEDTRRNRWYLFRPEHQFLPNSTAEFNGQEMRVSWGGKSFIKGVIDPGEQLVVEKIEYFSGPTMSWDVIYAKLLTSPHLGATIRVQDLFRPSDRPEIPIRPRADYLQELKRD
jgi:hypothetical protein